MRELYKDRREAGKILGGELKGIQSRQRLLVLGLPRGGVVVASEVASALDADLDVLVVRKMGVPGRKEVAMGAIASGGAEFLNEEMTRRVGITDHEIETTRENEKIELKRREKLYRGDRAPFVSHGRTVILVDDGIATGATVRAAVTALKGLGPERIIVAVPVAPPEAVEELERLADLVVCPLTPGNFRAVGQWYQGFAQTSDEEVRRILSQAWDSG
ncbi:MAG: phosphoribosyltransferase [Desulfosalsimonas sp.]